MFDYGPFDGGVYLVMEYLRGESLSARLARAPRLTTARVIDIGLQLARIVGAAHAAGVIHRDLKPDNVHLVPDPMRPGSERLKVIDFGVAKLTRQPCSRHTQRGDLLGTPFYMAPEQCVHAGTVDPRCDVYSLGCLLYQLVTGTVPFRGSLVEILLAHQNQLPEPPRLYDRSIPEPLEALILAMLSKAPDGRPPSMDAVARALGAIGGTEAVPPVAPVCRRVWLGLCVGVGLMVAGLGHLATLW